MSSVFINQAILWYYILMSRNVENKVEGRQQEGHESLFEGHRQEWDEKSDAGQYARRERALSAGKLVLGISLYKEKEQLSREKGEKGAEKAERYKPLQEALREHDVDIAGLKGKKEALFRVREDLRKRHEDFRNAEKETGRILASFSGKKREILFQALDRELNPMQRDKKPLQPKERETFARALGELDKRTAEVGAKEKPQNPQAMRMAVYLYMKQERVFEAEDKVNGLREQALDAELNLQMGERNFAELLNAQPELASRMLGIVTNKRFSEDQKVRAIDAALVEINDPEQKRVIGDYLSALEQYAKRSPELQRQTEALERSLRTDQEVITRSRELADEEKVLAQIPEEKGAQIAGEEKQRYESDMG